MILLGVIIISYLLGSVSFGFIVAKLWKGIDIREHGSGNIGATNVFRTLGPGPGIVALLGDFSKGLFAAIIGLTMGGDIYAVIAGFAVVLGHSYSIFLRFKGGKIIATGVGVIFAMDYLVALIALLIFVIVLFLGRYVSLASIIGAVSVPVLMIILKAPLSFFLFGTLGAIFAVFKHLANIKRLLAGTEYRIGDKKK